MKNVEETCLLSAWQASFRWHELYLGSITELGNLHDDAKGNAQSRFKRERQNTEASCRGGLIRSSDEISVMEMKRRD
ncbi:MAG: hypothetical protein IIB82_15275 [Bacteroidetes bacterium]|nr:hypothetical protein [Bacteroidota bacterium]